MALKGKRATLGDLPILHNNVGGPAPCWEDGREDFLRDSLCILVSFRKRRGFVNRFANAEIPYLN